MKKFINKLINKLGYEIKRTNKNKISIQNRLDSYYLSQLGNPKTVIDVGVGYGTPELYTAFPEAHFILIEPVEDFKPYLEKIKKNYSCEIYYRGLSNTEGEKIMDIDQNNLQKSSFKERSDLTKTHNTLARKNIKLTTLNKMLSERQTIATPILLKIDTEGYELEVLEGGDKYLNKIDIVVAELSIAKRFEDSYNFEDIIKYLYAQRFKVFDIPHIKYLNNKPGAQYLDMIFKRY